jgi:uncharacterized protein (TIGR03437 family)
MLAKVSVRLCWRTNSRFVLLAAILLSSTLQGQLSATYFDDSAPDRVLLGNAYYELALSKVNGAILQLTDKSTAAPLMLGSRSGCLWGSNFDYPGPNSGFVGGCSYQAGKPNSFAYSWDSSRFELKLSYAHDPTAVRQVDALFVISANSDRFFDMQLQIQNGWGGVLGQVLVPFDLMFVSSAVQSGYLPFLLPGVRLNSSFFTSGRSQTATYPGSTAFMDYMGLAVANGQLALYTVNPGGPIQPVTFGFAVNQASVGTFNLVHAFQTWVQNGSSYTSPVVRIRIGQSVKDTVLAFRSENGVESYPSVKQKLGDRFDTLVRAPVVKAEVHFFIDKPFLSAIPDLDQFQSPALLHPLAFQPGGHDRSGPDYLPPDPQWGTTQDFAAWVRAAQARSLLVMPYINPTWWDPESPTMVSLGPNLSTVTALDSTGNPISQTYGPDLGYVVCPFAPFVQSRLGSLMAEWKSAVPADYLFLDQIGSRPWFRDYNAAAPTPIRYSDGWLAFWNTYSSQGLTTEDGWDRLAAEGIGLMGSPLTGATSFDIGNERYGLNSDGNLFLGPGNWDPYPLATWLMHDKALFYEKDLPELTTTENTEVITFDLVFGNFLKYLWPGNPANPPTPGRVQLAHVLHRTVVPLYAGSQFTDFTYLAPDVAMSTFGQLSVMANWQQTEPYSIGGNTILAGGYLATTADGTILAGALTQQLNGRPLSPGDHYFVIERRPRVASVWQPVGNDTPVSVDPPTDWTPGQPLQVTALDQDYNRLTNIEFSMDGQRVQFGYVNQFGGSLVDHYEITNLGSSQPAVSNAASFLGSPVAPGELVSLSGPGIGPQIPLELVVGPSGVVQNRLGQTQVLFDGIAAPLIYAGANQIVAAVPYAVAGKAITNVEILFQGSVLSQFVIPVAATAPGIFTLDETGAHEGAILNQDNSVNSGSHPADPGSIISIYGTGEGQTTPAGTDGLIATGTLPQPLIPVRVQIGGQEAEVLYAGAAPNTVAGVLQVNARIPSDISPGTRVPVVLIIGHARSAAGVTVAVH